MIFTKDVLRFSRMQWGFGCSSTCSALGRSKDPRAGPGVVLSARQPEALHNSKERGFMVHIPHWNLKKDMVYGPNFMV